MLSIFKNKKNTSMPKENLGMLVFGNTSEVIQAEKVLKSNNIKIRVMGPPPTIQTGCDLIIEFELILKLNIVRLLKKANISTQQIVPVTDPLLLPVDLFHIKNFGRFLMVRAANMKITVGKSTKLIVNISGGGCPDVPYLASKMVGKTLEQAPSPLEIGNTLCGYALGLAFEEIKKQEWQSC